MIKSDKALLSSNDKRMGQRTLSQNQNTGMLTMQHFGTRIKSSNAQNSKNYYRGNMMSRGGSKHTRDNRVDSLGHLQ